MARTLDPAQMAATWVQQMGSPQTQTRYKNGVQAVTTSPTALAASPEATQNYLNGIQQAVASGKRQASLNAVSLQSWQSTTINKGAPRLGTGAAASQNKFQTAMTKWAPIYTQISQQVAQMPKGGLANAVARSQAAITALMQAAGRA